MSVISETKEHLNEAKDTKALKDITKISPKPLETRDKKYHDKYINKYNKKVKDIKDTLMQGKKAKFRLNKAITRRR